MKVTVLLLFGSMLAGLLAFQPLIAQQAIDPEGHQLALDIEQGVTLMNQGEFLSADVQFKEVLARVEVVPPDLCFYFGKNSYHLKKYRQSIDWLNKYIELKGPNGQFTDQAKEYIELAKGDYQVKKTATTEKIPQANAAPKEKETVDCGVHPYVTCPVCKGTGVIVEQGRLGASVYKTCPYSDEYGRMRCEDYKLYVKGKLQPQE